MALGLMPCMFAVVALVLAYGTSTWLGWAQRSIFICGLQVDVLAAISIQRA